MSGDALPHGFFVEFLFSAAGIKPTSHMLYRIMGDTLDDLFTERYNAWVEEEKQKSSQVDKQEEEEGGEFLVKWKVWCFAFVFLSLCLLSLFVFLSFCLFVFVSFCVFLYFCLFVFLSLCLFVFVSLCLLVFLSLCLCVFLSLCLFVFVSLCLFVFVSLCLCVFLSLCLFVFLSFVWILHGLSCFLWIEQVSFFTHSVV
jgi:hypothetical protein